MQFNASVKTDSTGRLKGAYQGTTAADGLHLARKGQDVLVIPRRVAATQSGSNQIAVTLPDGGALVLAVSKFPTYQARLAAGVAAFLRGERAPFSDLAEFKLEPWLIVPAVLPFGIMIVTRGGAIFGAIGGVLAVACLAIAQIESMPRVARLGLILLVNAVIYAAVIVLMKNVPSATPTR